MRPPRDHDPREAATASAERAQSPVISFAQPPNSGDSSSYGPIIIIMQPEWHDASLSAES
jgi:hypothetical protein